MPKKKKFANISKALSYLNRKGSPQKIAKYLKEQKIKGHASDPESCPIANYCKKNTNDKDIRIYSYSSECSSDTLNISANKLDNGFKYSKKKMCFIGKTPNNIKKFIDMFDRNLFPELISL